ncbi:Tetratricopeptide repeat-containing protein [Flavobacterium gillisiae]|uniref:histidine kinase n=1 Tax=Flavobacterium gillisiae TaxID=150146 RepID=A0A1H4EB97_9FLAO|nr:tetratricopeptide repeat-containing sensor histidine kinase [Flavobacterium gillisiae]SEA82295.1 Tetratricopeptide repeat-containing protein [Flavobacterium gillisiae]
MRKNQFISVVFLVLFVFFGCTKKNSDNNKVNSSEDSLSTYFSLANDLSLSLENRKENVQKAFEIVVAQENDSLNRVNLFRVANRYYNINDQKDYSKTVQLVLGNSIRAKDSLSIGKAYSYLGDYYESKGVPDSAFMFYYKAEKVYDNLHQYSSLGKTLINKATLQYKAGDFSGSENSIIRALRVIKEEKKVNNILYDANNLLGILYVELGEYDNALSYHNKALAAIEDDVIPEQFQSRATSYNNIGYLYLNAHNYALAKSYFQKGLLQKNLIIQKTPLYAMILDNLAYAKFKLNETEGLPDLFYQSLKMRDSLNLTAGIFINKIHLSEYFASNKDSVKAVQYSKEALLLSRSTNISRDILVALKELAVVEPKNATIYNKEYIHINEELQKEERSMGEKFSRIEYETDVIKGENSDLTTQNRNLVYVFSFITILGLLTYIIKAQKTKNKVLLYKQQQQKANEDIYNLMISQQNTIETNRVEEKRRVAQELHDGVLGRMFGVRMNLDGLNGFQDEMAVQQRSSYLSELKNIEQDIREISHDLNREKSELINNFVAIVDNLFEEQRKTYPSKLVSNIDSTIKWELLVNSVKINLYRIIQESLQNINKYANANTIKIELKKKDGNLSLVISDNGIGFNSKIKNKGIGIQNMLSRTKECHGEFHIKSKKGDGTIITIIIPIEQKLIPT